MYCERKLKLRSHNISYCLIEVDTKAVLTIPLLTDQFSITGDVALQDGDYCI